MGRGALQAILEMIGLVFPVTFSPQATPSFSVIQKEILFSSEPLTPPPDRIYAPSQKATYLAMVGEGSKGVEINKWVSSSKFSPSPLPQDALCAAHKGIRGGSRLCIKAWGSVSSQVTGS